MRQDEWRDIPGYEAMYQASCEGGIRSLDRITPDGRKGGTNRNRKGKTLKQIVRNSDGYLAVDLSKDGKTKLASVHILVALAWIGPRPEDMEVRHGPNGQLDNSVNNLSYGTHRDNILLDRRRDGTDGRKAVVDGFGILFDSIAEAAESYRISNGHICEVCKGKRQTAGGTTWKYLEIPSCDK
jgi:hypothetical protein